MPAYDGLIGLYLDRNAITELPEQCKSPSTAWSSARERFSVLLGAVFAKLGLLSEVSRALARIDLHSVSRHLLLNAKRLLLRVLVGECSNSVDVDV